ncbi:MAG: hypothetical protein IJV50_08830 [Lachnospiraceae bacterium]|nr:hypothetical protein [Lachnospiraceae bacterium]
MSRKQMGKERVTPYGTLKSVINDEYYQSGQLKSAMVEEESVLETPYGRLIPNYRCSDLRKKYREAVTFFQDGRLESIYLETPQPIQTSVGCMDAELATFYPDGAVKRLFPLYGQIGGYWTEENEYTLAKKVKLQLLNQVFDVAPLCITFFPSGQVRSLTIWQQETIAVDTRYGQVKTKTGFELFESGTLKSIEPVFGTSLMTEYGRLYPYDSDNYRLHAEGNSLSFAENGKLLSAKTIQSKIKIEKDGKERFIQAPTVEDPLTGARRLSSLRLIFEDGSVKIEDVSGLDEQFENAMISII